MLYIKLIGMSIEHHASKSSALLYTLDHCVGLKGHTFFSEEGSVAYHIMQLKCLTLCTLHTLDLLGWVKRSANEIVQIRII